LAMWPGGIPTGKRIGLVSSRLGRQLDTKTTWFSVLRTACAKFQSKDVLVTSPKTATARIVDRCAELFGIKQLRIILPNNRAQTTDEWLESVLEMKESSDVAVNYAYLSPPLEKSEGNDDLPTENEIALRDRAIVSAADRLYAIHVRPKGSLYSLICERLRDPSFPAASVFVGMSPSLTPAHVADKLMELGAVGWYLLNPPTSSSQSDKELSDSMRSAESAPIIPMPSSENWSFLTHCTRRRNGPWPEQAESDYLDDLILAEQSADRSPLATLKNIISKKRLCASPLAIRGGTPVVSFTEVPLAELSNLREFRPHRGRWDFEPFGICVKQSWLEEKQARRVCYGSNETWDSLNESNRPWFQVAQSVTPKGTTIDWTVEREWRVVGDVDLSDLQPDEGVVFVRTEKEANSLATTSPWPICVLGE